MSHASIAVSPKWGGIINVTVLGALSFSVAVHFLYWQCGTTIGVGVSQSNPPLPPCSAILPIITERVSHKQRVIWLALLPCQGALLLCILLLV